MVSSLDCALDQHLIGFSRYLRLQGLNVGVQETLDALQAIKTVSVPTEANVKAISRSLFCNSKEDFLQFHELFDTYWKGDPKRFKSHLEVSHRVQKKESPSSLIWLGATSQATENEQQSKEVSGANTQERLCRTDFSKIEEVDAEALEDLAKKLWQEMNKRLSRKRKQNLLKGQVNLRRTIRRSISSGGDPLNLLYRRRKPYKPRLVVFLDVSGSMDKYSFYLLRFIYAIQENFRQVDSFLFSTRLLCITDIMHRPKFSEQLKELTEKADSWSSGTTMGKCLQEFNQRFAKFSLSSQSIVLIMSDGLDTGDSYQLHGELQKIARRSKKLIWLNPLKGTRGYLPEAKGMRAALPLVDVFSSAHNLESLLELEKHLQNVQ
jgi:uncharacterized protein with von Willebrand factor type A (vWA) domain